MVDDGLSDDDERRVFGELLYDRLQVILELVQDVPDIKKRLVRLEEDVLELKSDMKIVKAAVTDTSKQVYNHEARITRLEAKRA